ncbi:MAG: hypothetical protein ACE5D3_01040 [Candidatus Binatia bacterium]
MNKSVGKYISTALKEMAGCYKNSMKKGFPADITQCATVVGGDLKGKVDKARQKAGANFAKKCASVSLADVGALTQCPSPCGSLGAILDFSSLLDCQLCLADADAELLTEASFGGAGSGFSKGQQSCLNAVGKSGAVHAKIVLKTLAKCRQSVDAGKSTTDCADPNQNDPKGKLAKSLLKLQGNIAKKCSDSVLTGLGVCNGAAFTLAAAQDCISQVYGSTSGDGSATISSDCGLDENCDLADENSLTCLVDCGQVSHVVQDIFSASCTASACHSSTAAASGLVLETGLSAANLIGVDAVELLAKRVVIGDSASSWLFKKISEPIPAVGSRMPVGAVPLNAAEQQAVKDWIDLELSACGDGVCDFVGAGEAADSCPEDCGRSVPAEVQAIFDSNCSSSGCHDLFSAAQGLNLSAAVAGVETVNVVSSEAPGFNDLVEPGDSANSWLFTKISQAVPGVGAQMPLGGLPLSATDQQTIQDWIDGGALTR